jgi:hypothetical protein
VIDYDHCIGWKVHTHCQGGRCHDNSEFARSERTLHPRTFSFVEISDMERDTSLCDVCKYIACAMSID